MAEANNDIPAGLTETQIDTLLQFRERVKDELTHQTRHNNYHLCRWLRARGWDLDKAEKMFRANVVWRKKWSIDNLLETWTPPEAAVKYYPGGVCGFDKEHCAVWVAPYGRIDMRGLSMSITKEDFIKYHLYIVETLCRLGDEQMAKTGAKELHLVFIDDLQGFGMKQLMSPGMDRLLKVMAIVEANYPECLKKGYIVNAPSIWNLIWNVCKPFMSEDTKRKLVLLGSDWREKVTEVIDPEQLPVHYGGTQRGPGGDPYCSHKICMGGEVDEKYYLKNQQLVNPKLWTETTINAGGTLDIPFEVNEPGAIINWVFKTDKMDIAFGINFSESDNSETPVLPLKRVGCQNTPEMGQYECQQVGTYVFQFSNVFSWLNPKKLGYYVYLATASGAEERAKDLLINRQKKHKTGKYWFKPKK